MFMSYSCFYAFYWNCGDHVSVQHWTESCHALTGSTGWRCCYLGTCSLHVGAALQSHWGYLCRHVGLMIEYTVPQSFFFFFLLVCFLCGFVFVFFFFQDFIIMLHSNCKNSLQTEIEIRNPSHLLHLQTSCIAPAGWLGLLQLDASSTTTTETWVLPRQLRRPTCWARSCARHTKQEDVPELLLLSRSQKPQSWLCFRLWTCGILSVTDSKRLVWGIHPALLPTP